MKRAHRFHLKLVESGFLGECKRGRVNSLVHLHVTEKSAQHDKTTAREARCMRWAWS